MPRMIERYTGTVFDVPNKRAEEYERMGFRYVEQPEPVDAAESEPEEPQQEESAVDDEKPTEDSTIAEIRSYAAGRGIELPKGGKKADLLAAIE